MAGQSHKHSLIEAVTNTFIGFVGSLAIQHWVIPLMSGYHTSPTQSVAITIVFTVWSVSRNYGMRRLHNWWEHR